MNSSPLLPVLISSTEERSPVPSWLTWLSATLLFVILHSPHEVVVTTLGTILEWSRQTEFVHNFLSAVSGKYARSEMTDLIILGENALIVPAKKFFMIVGLCILLVPIISFTRKVSWIWEGAALRRRLADAGILFFVLALLMVPRFLQGFGDEYATMSLSPFTEGYGIFYRRFLMPSLAHVVGVYGYGWYFFFSLFLTFCLIVAVRLWLEHNRIEHSILFSLSLMTSSFVMFNFQLPGYPEQIAFILLLVCSIVPMNAHARVGAFALALSAHEVAALVFIPAAWFFFPRQERYRLLIVVALYFGAAFVGHALTDFQFIGKIISENTWTKPRQYFLDNSLTALTGAFFGYKLFWLVVVAALVVALRKNMVQVAIALLVIVTAPLVLIAIASDASRIAGFGFFALLIALVVLTAQSPMNKRYLMTLVIANLILPSGYVDLHSGAGIQILPGAYNLVTTLVRTIIGSLVP
jgi:hypothetical protein